MADKGWQRKFEDPIPLPDGRALITLRDAANYITALPKKEAAAPEWQAAIEALMLVADIGGPTMFARIGLAGSYVWAPAGPIEPVLIAKIAKAIMRIRTSLGIGVAIPNFVYRWRQRRAVPEPQ